MMYRDVIELHEGMRIYAYINEDEYELLNLLSIDEEYQVATFLNEETFEEITLSKDTIDDYYYLLVNYKNYIVGKIKYNESKFTLKVNKDIIDASKNGYMINDYISIMIYEFMPKKVFLKILEYTFKRASWSIEKHHMEFLWKDYMERLQNRYKLFTTKDSKYTDNINLNDVINDENIELPDSFFYDIEDEMNTYIIGWNIYYYEPSIDITKITHKYFFIYSEDEDIFVLFLVECNDIKYNIENIDTETYLDTCDFMDQN